MRPYLLSVQVTISEHIPGWNKYVGILRFVWMYVYVGLTEYGILISISNPVSLLDLKIWARIMVPGKGRLKTESLETHFIFIMNTYPSVFFSFRNKCFRSQNHLGSAWERSTGPCRGGAGPPQTMSTVTEAFLAVWRRGMWVSAGACTAAMPAGSPLPPTSSIPASSTSHSASHAHSRMCTYFISETII